MNMLKLATTAIAVVLGGWLMFDGTRAFITGNYTTPQHGPGAGRLGPWAALVSAVGLDPRSTPIKAVHIGLGGLWLAAAVALWISPAFGRAGLIACAALSLWYAPFGTLLGVVELVLLFLPQMRTMS